MDMGKDKTPIKLVKWGEVGETIQLQSQLSIGRDTADFILENGELKCWNGGAFVTTDIPYEIVEKIEFQTL